jgi:3-isopropylmalate/(R)-2-methylmalate dehydratase small subunit
MKQHALEVVRPDFAAGVKAGDIIIAGRFFGCGSSREAAPLVLKALGVCAVVADSFARIFYRNAIAIGLPAIDCPGVSSLFDEGDSAVVSFARMTVTSAATVRSLAFQPFPGEMLRVLESGGIEPLLRSMNLPQARNR